MTDPNLIAGPFADNDQLNRALCEAATAGKRVQFSERLGRVLQASVRRVPAAERRQMREDELGDDGGDDSGGMYEAKVSQADKMNQNGRIYPRAVMQANLDRMKPLLKQGYVTGAVDHLGEVEGGNLKSTPIIWRELSMEDDGSVMGKFQIVKGHSAGNDLKTQLDAGMAVGISTFGYGSAHEPGEDEVEAYSIPDGVQAVVMNDDYEMVKADAVDNPSVPDARVCQDGKVAGKGQTSGKDARAGSAKKERASAIIVNPHSKNWALYAAKEGQIDAGVFEGQEPPADRFHGSYFLGLDSAYSIEEAGHYQFPILTAGGKLNAEAVCAAVARSHSKSEIHAAAVEIQEAIQKKDPHAIKVQESRRQPKGAMTASDVKKQLRPVAERTDRKPLTKRYSQYFQGDNAFEPAGDVTLAPKLENDAYRVVSSWTGVAFVRTRPQTDDLYQFPNSIMEKVLKEIDNFWDPQTEADYAKFGVMHNRGVMLEGPPGTGKTSIAHQVAEQVIDAGDVVFYAKSIPVLAEGLHAFREVEPTRKVVCILEDADEYIGYQERQFLNLLDGEESVSGVLYVATTNYAERFPPRLLRPGRFDKRIVVGPPPIEGRRAYLAKKLEGVEPAEEIDRLAKETEGLSFGHLRELITAVYALKEPKENVLARLKGKPAKAVDSAVVSTPRGGAKEAVQHGSRLEGQSKATEGRKQQGDKAMAENTMIVNENAGRSDKAFAEALKPLLKHIRESTDVELPVREVLPAEVAERTTKLEGQIAERDAKLAENVKTIAGLQAQIDTFKAEQANAVRIGKVTLKADALTKDNRFRDDLLEDIAAAAKDASFDDTKVEALIQANAARYEKISGKVKAAPKNNSGAQPEKLIAGMLGRNTSEEQIEESLENADESTNEPADAPRVLPGLAEAWGSKRKPAAESAA